MPRTTAHAHSYPCFPRAQRAQADECGGGAFGVLCEPRDLPKNLTLWYLLAIFRALFSFSFSCSSRSSASSLRSASMRAPGVMDSCVSFFAYPAQEALCLADCAFDLVHTRHSIFHVARRDTRPCATTAAAAAAPPTLLEGHRGQKMASTPTWPVALSLHRGHEGALLC